MFLLLLLIVLLTVLIIPLLFVAYYLFDHRNINGATQRMRHVLFFLVLGKILLFTIVLGVDIELALGIPALSNAILLPLVVAVVIPNIINWWAFFQIRKILQTL